MTEYCMTIGLMKEYDMFSKRELKLIKDFDDDDYINLQCWYNKDEDDDIMCYSNVVFTSDDFDFEYKYFIRYNTSSYFALTLCGCEVELDEGRYDEDGNVYYENEDGNIIGIIIEEYYSKGEFYTKVRLNKEKECYELFKKTLL